jgi:hypothetical protein
MDTLQTPAPRKDRFQIIELEERIAPSLLNVDVDVRDITVRDNLNNNNINAVSLGPVTQLQ